MIYDISIVSLLFGLPCGLRNPYTPRLLHALHLWRRDPSQPKPSRLSTQRGTATMEVEWSSVRSLLKSCSMPASFQKEFHVWRVANDLVKKLMFITVHYCSLSDLRAHNWGLSCLSWCSQRCWFLLGMDLRARRIVGPKTERLGPSQSSPV